MNLQTNRWLIHRRTFLRGVGTALALPLLDVMQPARAQAAARPRRCVFIYTPNGVSVPSWFPPENGTGFTFSPTLKALEPLRADVSILSGLHHPNAKSGHTVADNWLTGAALDATPGYKYRNSISADQLIAEQLGKATRFPSLELSSAGGTGKQGNAATLSWSRGAVAIPAESNPRLVFERLFAVQSGGAEAQRKSLRRDRALLDSVLEDAQSLARKVGRNDQEKLDEYLTAVREIEQRVQRADEWVAIPKPQADDKFIAATSMKQNIGDYLRTTYDLMALAIRTDSTRVLTYLVDRETSTFTVPDTGVKLGHHALSHHNNDVRMLADMATVDAFLVQQFAAFLSTLKNTKEHDGTLLDNTVVLYGSGASWTHLHQHLPIVLAGGGQLGLRHGQHLDLSKAAPTAMQARRANEENNQRANSFPVNPDARMSNLLLTMMQTMGLKDDRFADSTKPISELLA